MCRFGGLLLNTTSYISAHDIANIYHQSITKEERHKTYRAIIELPRRRRSVEHLKIYLLIRPSVRHPSLTFHIFVFSSETTEQNSTKLDGKQDLNIIYQVCVSSGR